MELALDKILLDDELRIRPLHPDVVEHYADILPELPPVDVFVVGEDYLLAGGFHRLAAAQQLEWETIPVTLHHGTREDALVFAYTANAKHGLPLSTEEERRAILRLAATTVAGSKLSNVELGKKFGRSEFFVRRVLHSAAVREAVPLARELPAVFTPTKLEFISRAPEEIWEPLTRAAYHGGWGVDETERRVREINAGKPIEEVFVRPTPEYIPPSQPDAPDPETAHLLDYMELSRALTHIAPLLAVGRYDWRDVPRDEGGVLLMQLGLIRVQLERIMAFLMGQGFEPADPHTVSDYELIEV